MRKREREREREKERELEVKIKRDVSQGGVKIRDWREKWILAVNL